MDEQGRQGRIDTLRRETVARLRAAGGEREAIAVAIRQYLDEGMEVVQSPSALWDYFATSSPCLPKQAGYDEQEADRIIRIFSTVSHQKFGGGRPLPPDWPWFEEGHA